MSFEYIGFVGVLLGIVWVVFEAVIKALPIDSELSKILSESLTKLTQANFSERIKKWNELFLKGFDWLYKGKKTITNSLCWDYVLLGTCIAIASSPFRLIVEEGYKLDVILLISVIFPISTGVIPILLALSMLLILGFTYILDIVGIKTALLKIEKEIETENGRALALKKVFLGVIIFGLVRVTEVIQRTTKVLENTKVQIVGGLSGGIGGGLALGIGGGAVWGVVWGVIIGVMIILLINRLKSEDDPSKDLNRNIFGYLTKISVPKVWLTSIGAIGIISIVRYLFFDGVESIFFIKQISDNLYLLLYPVMNLYADSFSVIETRWVLNKAKNLSFIKFIGLIVFDLFATAIILSL